MRYTGSVCAVFLTSVLPSFVSAQESAVKAAPTLAETRSAAYDAYNSSDFKACAPLFEQVAMAGSGAAAVNEFYNAGCCYARAANKDKAFDMLKHAIDGGYHKLNHIKFDSDLETLHDDPRWQPLLETIVAQPIRITENITRNPTEAAFVYDDVQNFLRAITLVPAGHDPTEILKKEYFGRATPGLKQFVVKYELTAEAVAAAMKKRPEKYSQLGERLGQLKSREAAFRAAYVRFKGVVPQVVFPPTYFLVSDYGGVASGSPDGQLITIERRTRESIDRMETLLVHELLHFQQLKAAGPDEFYALFGEKKTLLGLTIREGTAEFVADRVTGRITQDDALTYVAEHEEALWQRFQGQMASRDTTGWMWSKPSDPNQPRDVAYALGSRIVEAFYKRATDKTQAMQEILSVTDYPRLLERSGYATKFSTTVPGDARPTP